MHGTIWNVIPASHLPRRLDMFSHTMVRSTLVLAAALGAVSATGLADVAPAATVAPLSGAVSVAQVTPPAVPDVSTAPRKMPGGAKSPYITLVRGA